MVPIGVIENSLSTLVIDLNTQKGVGMVHENGELLEVHATLCSQRHAVVHMHSLQSDFSAMSPEKEVAEFGQIDAPIVVGVQPEQVLHDVVDLSQ